MADTSTLSSQGRKLLLLKVLLWVVRATMITVGVALGMMIGNRFSNGGNEWTFSILMGLAVTTLFYYSALLFIGHHWLRKSETRRADCRVALYGLLVLGPMLLFISIP
jgi:hypothetical protein